MSRIGNLPVKIPDNVEVKVDGNIVEVKGPKGQLSCDIAPQLKIEITGKDLLISRKKEDNRSKSLHGLTRVLINNNILGVSSGWDKKLEMVGVGYRASGGGDTLNLNVGFSHTVTIKAPKGISFSVSDNTKISVSGCDKQLVGQVAANVRQVKKPEVYKGKGIRYEGEIVKRKPGKAGKAVIGAAK